MKYILFLFILFSSYCSKAKEESKPPSANTSITLNALSDFELINKEGFGIAYEDLDRQVLAIDAEQFKDVFAAAEGRFTGENGVYDISFSSMLETDGESSYRVLIDNKLVGEFQNPESEVDFELYEYTMENITLVKGQRIEVEFNSHSNGKIPEGDGFAYSRGRWKSMELTSSN